MSTTTDVRSVCGNGPQFQQHQCIEVACSECGEQLGDDTILHFDSIAAALAEINRSEWQINEDAVRCCDCIQAADGDTATLTVAVSKCEFCWPTLFSDDTTQNSCQCRNPGTTITHRLRVPFISHTHRAFTTHSCVTLACGGCGQSVSGNEEYDPHFSSPDRALQRAADDYDWLVSDVLVCCAGCAESRACAAVGHQFPDEPNHVLAGGIELRCCSNCDATVRNPIGERDQPWL